MSIEQVDHIIIIITRVILFNLTLSSSQNFRIAKFSLSFFGGHHSHNK